MLWPESIVRQTLIVLVFAGLLCSAAASSPIGPSSVCACNITVAVCTGSPVTFGANGTVQCCSPSSVCFCPIGQGNLTVVVPASASVGLYLPNAGYADAGCFKFWTGVPTGITTMLGLGLVYGPTGSLVGNEELSWTPSQYGGNSWTFTGKPNGQIAAMCTVKSCDPGDPYSRPNAGHFLQLTNSLLVPQTFDLDVHVGVAASLDTTCPCKWGVNSPEMCMGPWEPYAGYPRMAHCHNLPGAGCDIFYCKCDDGWGNSRGARCMGSCTDGIENNDETGVDCGGCTCPPCPDPVNCTQTETTGTTTSTTASGTQSQSTATTATTIITTTTTTVASSSGLTTKASGSTTAVTSTATTAATTTNASSTSSSHTSSASSGQMKNDMQMSVVVTVLFLFLL